MKPTEEKRMTRLKLSKGDIATVNEDGKLVPLLPHHLQCFRVMENIDADTICVCDMAKKQVRKV